MRTREYTAGAVQAIRRLVHAVDSSVWRSGLLRCHVMKRCLLKILFAILLCTTHAGLAVSMSIAVQEDDWGDAKPREIRAIALSAADEIGRHCSRTRLGAIVVYHRADHPQTALERTRDGKIPVGLQARDRQCAQIAFQFAHEFCHVLATHSAGARPVEKGSARPNLWLEESFAEAASLFALRAMSRSWQRGAPFRDWKSYAPEFAVYADERMRVADSAARRDFARWFRQNEPSLRRNGELREKNAAIAVQLLPLLEAEPRGWEAITFLNARPASARLPLAAFLAAWQESCPPTLRPFVAKVATVFGARL